MKSTIRFKIITVAALICLSLVVFISSCSKDSNSAPPATNKTNLQKAIDSANWYINNTTEGTKPGQYTAGSKAPLNTAITSATSVLNDPASTQAQLDNAAVNLNAATGTYKSNLISEVAAADLVAFWKFNGNANDSSGNGHNGTLSTGAAFFGAGTVVLTNDRFGNAEKAYHFDKGGNIEIPFATAFNPQQMSISLWARQDTTGRTVNPNNDYLISFNRWNGWKFQKQPTRPFFTVKAFNTPDTVYYDRDAALDLNSTTVWYNLVVTFKPGEMDFYINGDLAKSWTNVPGTPITVAAPPNITIGSDLPTSAYSTDPNDPNYVNYGGFWSGDLDDVMFYKVALTAPQVLSIYNNQNTQ